MTGDETLTLENGAPLSDMDSLYEIVDDLRVELLPLSAYGNWIASELGAVINRFAKAQRLGWGTVETLFRFKSSPRTQRRPDVAYVSFERWPKGKRPSRGNAWDVVPDLVVEIVSPTNYAEEIPTRIREYFEAGVRRAWVIYIHESLVYDYASPLSIQALGPGDALDGGDVLPGFRLPLADLFEPEAEDEAEPPTGV